jgi:hypothetical protein
MPKTLAVLLQSGRMSWREIARNGMGTVTLQGGLFSDIAAPVPKQPCQALRMVVGCKIL